MRCEFAHRRCLIVPVLASRLQVTLNHLDQLKSIVGDEPISSALLADAYRRCVDTYLRLPISELFALRHTLARFVQDRHVKVSTGVLLTSIHDLHDGPHSALSLVLCNGTRLQCLIRHHR